MVRADRPAYTPSVRGPAPASGVRRPGPASGSSVRGRGRTPGTQVRRPAPASGARVWRPASGSSVRVQRPGSRPNARHPGPASRSGVQVRRPGPRSRVRSTAAAVRRTNRRPRPTRCPRGGQEGHGGATSRAPGRPGGPSVDDGRRMGRAPVRRGIRPGMVQAAFRTARGGAVARGSYGAAEPDGDGLAPGSGGSTILSSDSAIFVGSWTPWLVRTAIVTPSAGR
jgi:hypothetical protein